MRRPSPRHGFSLIEALVVLAIGGMALSIIFSIGVKAGDTGFGLGRRAMAAADHDLAYADVRTVIRSLELRPAATFDPEIDEAVVGGPDRLVGHVVMERGTQCAPQGWAGRLTLEIVPRDDGASVVMCVAAGRRVPLLVVPGDEAVLSYSTDGLVWTTSVSTLPPPRQFGQELVSARLWVRLTLPPQPDVIELASSGSPLSWVRSDVF